MPAASPRHRASTRWFILGLLGILVGGAPPVRGISSTIVVSQVYGGGGNAGSSYRNDFIELYNRGTVAVDVTGWSVQYASASGATWQVTPLAGTIEPGRYYLVQQAAGSAASGTLPPPDATGTIAMAATAGKVALVDSSAPLTGACPASTSIVDLVGYGAANCAEGTATPQLANAVAAFRNRDASGIEVDTDSNTTDFLTGPARPGNHPAGRAPLGTASASPTSAPPLATTLLSVAIVPGAGPTSTGLSVTVDLSGIGGSAALPLGDDGANGDAIAGDLVFSLETTIAAGTTAGGKLLPFTVADQQGRLAIGTIALTVLGPIPPSTTMVISQVYGGGGNSGATYRNDFIELYNLGATPVNLSGWSVQYASATGSTWQKTDLAGIVPPGRFYLVQQAAGAGGSVDLPTPDAIGTIALAATSGKVALVAAATPLSGTCPASTAVDFVGFGAANCSETAPTPPLSNVAAALRNGSGAIDTNSNLADFTVGAPMPRTSVGLPPTGTGLSLPGSAAPGESLLLTVAAVPGQFPVAAGLAVTADLAPLGGGPTALLDDGTAGDAVAGDSIFSRDVTVGTTAPGPATVIATVADGLGRQSRISIVLAVEAPPSPISMLQGTGAVSPAVGQFVTTTGIVTGLKANGFFLQSADADIDADQSTSEGIFVFTGGLPPTAAAVGHRVRVSGTVTEFVPASDPLSPPLTEIGGGGSPAVAVRLIATGHPLPTPRGLVASDTNPEGPLEQLERFEGMRVEVDALRVVAPTQAAFVDEPSATSVSNGVFYGVIDGVARPFREPGIDSRVALPAGAPCCVPRFDGNPERLRVDSDGLLGATRLEVNAGALVSQLVGPLDVGGRTFTLLPEPATPPMISGLASARPVPAPGENEFTVASFNTERFFDTVDDPAVDDPVLTPAALAMRLQKASLAVRQVLRSPDIIGVQEVENLGALQALAGQLNADAVLAGEADPQYTAYLVEGNDIGGIDSGFLVKQARVVVLGVTQEGAAATYVDPSDGSVDLLNDRPPLLLRASVLGPAGSSQSVTVIVNHLRSLSGLEGPDGVRIRAKRQAQAEFLATLIQARQTADPSEQLVSIGDYNAFPFNDGYVDVMGTIIGRPTPPDHVVSASADLVDPDLTNLVDQLSPVERYSFSFDGHAQTLDQVLVNAPLLARVSRVHMARSNADFPESLRNDANRPERLSDHDMPVAYFTFVDAPVITLNGSNPMTVECGSAFVDPGATALDARFGDLTGDIVVTGQVDAERPGTYTLTYSVANGVLTTVVTRTVVVVDTQPPVMTQAFAWPVVLWPANRRMVTVGLLYQVHDTCDPDVSCSVSVRSSDPDSGTAGTDLSPDWEIVDASHVRLRAETSPRTSGRLYTITVTCVDHSGNARARHATVFVPRLGR